MPPESDIQSLLHGNHLPQRKDSQTSASLPAQECGNVQLVIFIERAHLRRRPAIVVETGTLGSEGIVIHPAGWCSLTNLGLDRLR